MKRPAAVIALFALAAWAQPGAAEPTARSAETGPSFACAGSLTPTERTVCADAELAAADRLMAKLYAASRTSAFGTGPSNQTAAQRTTLKSLAGCKAERDCLANVYRARNVELAVAVLMTDPALSLAALRQFDPQAAPLYEAVQIYASAPAGADWRSAAMATPRVRLLSLVAPYFDRLKSDTDQTYGSAIMSDSVHGPADLLAREANMVTFLQVVPVYFENTPLPLPCAAILRLPGLAEVGDPVFGSTMDNFMLQPDCESTLPPLPRLDALVSAADTLWPDCQGTMRYLYYRSFAASVDRARMGLPVKGEAKPRALPVRRGIAPKTIAAAATELDGYYRQYLHLAPAAARKRAVAWVDAVTQGTRSCEATE